MLRLILYVPIAGLMKDLQRDNTATFHFVEGDIESEPGPGIAGYYDPPYYSYYKFPRSFSDDDTSLLEAYDLLYDILVEEGPFDGILGFSHGGTLAAGFLIHQAKMYPHKPPLVRCAIFVNSIPPFRMDPGRDQCPVIDDDLEGYINIPTVSIAGAKDWLFEYSVMLHHICNEKDSSLVVHSKGHYIPGDQKNVTVMSAAIRKLALRVMSVYGW